MLGKNKNFIFDFSYYLRVLFLDNFFENLLFLNVDFCGFVLYYFYVRIGHFGIFAGFGLKIPLFLLFCVIFLHLYVFLKQLRENRRFYDEKL